MLFSCLGCISNKIGKLESICKVERVDKLDSIDQLSSEARVTSVKSQSNQGVSQSVKESLTWITPILKNRPGVHLKVHYWLQFWYCQAHWLQLLCHNVKVKYISHGQWHKLLWNLTVNDSPFPLQKKTALKKAGNIGTRISDTANARCVVVHTFVEKKYPQTTLIPTNDCPNNFDNTLMILLYWYQSIIKVLLW